MLTKLIFSRNTFAIVAPVLSEIGRKLLKVLYVGLLCLPIMTTFYVFQERGKAQILKQAHRSNKRCARMAGKQALIRARDKSSRNRFQIKTVHRRLQLPVCNRWPSKTHGSWSICSISCSRSLWIGRDSLSFGKKWLEHWFKIWIGSDTDMSSIEISGGREIPAAFPERKLSAANKSLLEISALFRSFQDWCFALRISFWYSALLTRYLDLFSSVLWRAHSLYERLASVRNAHSFLDRHGMLPLPLGRVLTPFDLRAVSAMSGESSVIDSSMSKIVGLDGKYKALIWDVIRSFRRGTLIFERCGTRLTGGLQVGSIWAGLIRISKYM